MALKIVEWLRGRRPVLSPSLIARSDAIRQTIVIEGAVLDQVGKHRQLKATSTEAGGQLFGVGDADELRVMLATGPYPGDDRGRYHYRSDPAAAQRMIDKQADRGLLHLGEWHTHAEDVPHQSTHDTDAMGRLLAASELNVTDLFMLIVGRSSDLPGYRLYTLGRSGILDWNLRWEESGTPMIDP